MYASSASQDRTRRVKPPHQLEPLRSASDIEGPFRGATGVWLGVIVATALLVRSAPLLFGVHDNPNLWIDPDGYLTQARVLMDDGQGWRWNMRAFMYDRLVKAPLYPLFLSLFVGFPEFPLSAAIIQIVIGTAAVAGLYVIGHAMHSQRAGLIAAAIYAVWLPALAAANTFLQEQLYIPLVIAGLALLARAARRSASPTHFAVAGLVLGLAALARSMPLYYIGPAALLYIALTPDRPTASRQMLGLVAGFFVVVLPWCIYVSLRMGQLILIDNMGSAALGMAYRELRPELHTAPPATVIESLRMVWMAASRAPVDYVTNRLGDFQRLFRLVGGQWLELHAPVGSRMYALAVTDFARLSDLLFGLSAVLAPVGLVLARRRREAGMVALWGGVNVGLLIMFAWNGVRYRAPVEPVLISLAAVTLAGSWSRAHWSAVVTALAVSVAIGTAVATSIPRTAAAAVTYGFRQWVHADGLYQAIIVGEAGFGVYTGGGSLDLSLSVASLTPPGGPVRVRVFVDGRQAGQVTVRGKDQRLRYVSARQFAYVKLLATFEDGDRAAPVLVGITAPWPPPPERH